MRLKPQDTACSSKLTEPKEKKKKPKVVATALQEPMAPSPSLSESDFRNHIVNLRYDSMLNLFKQNQNSDCAFTLLVSSELGLVSSSYL
jgi:hypothetical protein